MNSNSGRGRLERFFSGKGFYIVLFLCAGVIGVSAWMMASGDRLLAEDVARMNRESLERQKVETVILPPRSTETMREALAEEPVPAMAEESQVWREEAEEPAAEAAEESGAELWCWPVSGELERVHDGDTLRYDVTLRDWRVHQGIDILAPLGTTVTAAHSGRVESIVRDDLYGTVLTVSHGDGTCSVYANLADTPAVAAGDWVEAGQVLGSVGDTALCEVGQGTHLHYAVTVDGQSADPLDYLPA